LENQISEAFMAPFNLVSKFCLAIMLMVISSGAGDLRDPPSLYHELGSAPGLSRIVDNLVSNLLADPRIKAHFKSTDLRACGHSLMTRLTCWQVNIIIRSKHGECA